MLVKNLLFALLRVGLVSLVCHGSGVWAGLLVKEDVDKLFADKYLVGDIQPNMPVWPLFSKSPVDPEAKPELVGYVFETIDFEPAIFCCPSSWTTRSLCSDRK